MPEFSPKQIQEDLAKNPESFWPVYWIHGQESMKVREITRRIRKTVLKTDLEVRGLNEDVFDASEVTGSVVVDAALSFGFGQGPRFIIIKDAHLLKETDALDALLGPKISRADLTSVCVFVAKDIDRRKKLSAKLLKSAAVIECGEVAETERAAWIDYLVKRKAVTISSEDKIALSNLEPWTLDIIERELEKIALSDSDKAELTLPESDRVTRLGVTTAEAFISALFSRKTSDALRLADSFSADPSIALPLTGLIAWYVRQLALTIETRRPPQSAGPMAGPKLSNWSQTWTQDQIQKMQSELSELDFGNKQTFQNAQALWTRFVLNSIDSGSVISRDTRASVNTCNP